jgi:LPS O-antigen subunit length determinant protein (WzzB/FepE family)
MENINGEINLIDCLKVIMKNKLIILLFLAVGILFSLGVVFLTPKTYQAETAIEIESMEGIPRRIFVLDGGQLTSEINYSFSQKYPSLNATFVSEGLVKINNYSAEKDLAEKGILDVISTVLPEETDSKSVIQAQINKLKIDMAKLSSEGQQVAEIDLRIFDLQNKLDGLKPTKIIQQPTVLKKRLNPVFSISLGGILGFFLGLVFISAKEWWDKNKENIS